MKYIYTIFPVLFIILFSPSVFADTIASMDGYWTLSGELINTNPYTVFITIPSNLTYTTQSLKSSDDFTVLTVKDNVNSITAWAEYNSILNGEKGFWMPPYSKVQVELRGVINCSLDSSNAQDKYEISGPALVDTVKLINLKNIFPVYKEGVELNNFNLYVQGSILKSNNTDTISMIIPAPIVLQNYYQFDKIVNDHNVDVWVYSYNNYITKHEKLAEHKTQNPELYNNLDEALIPNMDDEGIGVDIKPKIFDVPAMVFTTSSKEPLSFAYTMYWDYKYSN